MKFLLLTALAISGFGCGWTVREYRHIQGVDYCGDGQAVRVIYHYDLYGRRFDWTCDPDRWTR